MSQQTNSSTSANPLHTPEHPYSSNHNDPYSIPSTPSSEKRQRKTLLIQKQRQLQNDSINFNLSFNGSTNSLSNYSIDNSEASNQTRSFLPRTSSTRSSTTNLNASSSSSSNNGRIWPPGRRMKRFVLAMTISVLFCLLVIFRENAFSKSNNEFTMGTQQEEHRDVERDGHLKGHKDNKQEDTTPSSSSSTTTTTTSSGSTNPMQALGGIMSGIGFSSNKNNNKQPEEKHPLQPDDSYKSPIDDHAHAAHPQKVEIDSFDPKGELLKPSQNNNNEEEQKDNTGIKNNQPPEEASDTTETTDAEKEPEKDKEEELNNNRQPPLASRPPPPVSYAKTPYDPSMALQDPQFPADTTKNNSFVKQYCDLQGTDWFPVDKEMARNASLLNAPHSKIKSWHQRAPAALLLGPSHGGSDLLFQLLASHPQIANAVRSHFFTSSYKKFVRIKSNSDTENDVKVRTRSARMAYTAGHVSTQRQLQKNPNQIVVDNVRETLLYEQIMAPFVFCAMPWTKLVITVQHPIQRLLKHYQAARARGLGLSLEDWIARDLERMQQAGLILQPPQNTTQAEFEKQAKQTLANHEFWIQYQILTSHSMEASAGQSLYEAMIHPWFTWMEQMGRNPATEIVLVQKEVLTLDAQTLVQEYQRVIKQLGLQQHTPPEALVQSILDQKEADQQANKDVDDAKIRTQLQRFFGPYNAIFDQFVKSVYPAEALESQWRPELWKGQ